MTDTTFRIARESVEDRRGNSRCSANVFREKTRNIARRRELVASRRELPGNKVHALYMYTVLNNSTDKIYLTTHLSSYFQFNMFYSHKTRYFECSDNYFFCLRSVKKYHNIYIFPKCSQHDLHYLYMYLQ